jgi:copper chaperone CopZ
MEEMTIEQCVEHIVKTLEEFKVKKKDIEVNGETITFSYGGTEYLIFIETPEDIHYGITHMNGVELDSDFWMNKDEYGDYQYVEEYLYGVVLEKRYDYVKKIWKSLEKLEESDHEDDLTQIVAIYFGLTE